MATPLAPDGATMRYLRHQSSDDAPVEWWFAPNRMMYLIQSKTPDARTGTLAVDLDLDMAHHAVEDCEAVCEAFHLAAKYLRMAQTQEPA